MSKMSKNIKMGKKELFDDKRSVKSIYSRTMISKKVCLSINNVGKNIKEVLEESIRGSYDGKCLDEGYVKPSSSSIITYSSPIVQGSNIIFEVMFECQVCYPVEGQLINCIAKNISKVGIKGESSQESPSPFVVFISRDHEISNRLFTEIKEGDIFIARIIGQRFELNDKYVSVIAEIVDKTRYK